MPFGCRSFAIVLSPIVQCRAWSSVVMVTRSQDRKYIPQGGLEECQTIKITIRTTNRARDRRAARKAARRLRPGLRKAVRSREAAANRTTAEIDEYSKAMGRCRHRPFLFMIVWPLRPKLKKNSPRCESRAVWQTRFCGITEERCVLFQPGPLRSRSSRPFLLPEAAERPASRSRRSTILLSSPCCDRCAHPLRLQPLRRPH